MRVLFVCTGNQCRSPAAEGLWRRLAGEHQLAGSGCSAGTGAWAGIPAQPDTVAAAAELGVDLRAHRSQPVTPELMGGSDVVLGMAWRHVAWLRGLHPAFADRIHLFKPWCEGRPDPEGLTTDDIADPVGLPLEVHRQCLEEIQRLLTVAAGRLSRG
ncbi:MAG: arsenate reductase/protein-tyrosine-phosphatase family protein [Candidatus Xenobia bacterium]